VALTRQIALEIGRAFAVLAMVFLSLAATPSSATAPAGIDSGNALVAIAQSLCGGHDQPQLACHAPDACCRPDQALLPPNPPAIDLPVADGIAIDDGFVLAPTLRAAVPLDFRSRGPPRLSRA
jgi:hypothetical protein